MLWDKKVYCFRRAEAVTSWRKISVTTPLLLGSTRRRESSAGEVRASYEVTVGKLFEGEDMV